MSEGYLTKSLKNSAWQPPAGWRCLETIEAHTAGEPFRVILSGWPPVAGRNILEKRRFLQAHHDHLRRALIWEPRGHTDMYGCLLTEPDSPESDLGVIFLHNEGYSTMCGHGIIALTKVVLELGLIQKEGREVSMRIDTPAGQIISRAVRENNRVSRVSFQNVPSFVVALDETIDVPGLGVCHYDLAFGGAFYAFLRAEELGLQLIPAEFRKIVDLGCRLKQAIAVRQPVRHPYVEDLSFLYGVIIVGPPHNPGHHSRNVCIFAEGEVDRSPTGTGVSARADFHFARGELAVGEEFTVESLIGTCFTGRVVAETQFGPYPAVIPEVSGEAFLVGKSQFFLDPDDPLQHGFFLR